MERFDQGYEYVFPEEAGGDRNVEFSPKGIDGGDLLNNASPDQLLAHHLKLEKDDARAFWEDGFTLFKLWVPGSFREMINTERRRTPYPWSRDGFGEFLHDHGSQISLDEVSRRIKVFRTYNKYDVTTIRLIQRAGVNKAFVAIPHVRDETVKELLEFCIGMPYHKLRQALQDAYPRIDGGRVRNGKTKDQRRRDDETRAVRTISESHTGMIGEPSIFIPRQYRQTAEEEIRAHEVFDIAMKRLGVNDRDGFFLRVVELIAREWLTVDDRHAIESRLNAYFSGDAARRALAA